jgi:hypothetical protein
VGEQPSPVSRAFLAGRLEALDLVLSSEPTLGDHPPEPLHLAEVPQQVVGVPVRARRHTLASRGIGDQLPEEP